MPSLHYDYNPMRVQILVHGISDLFCHSFLELKALAEAVN
jgi:hypothetical protein